MEQAHCLSTRTGQDLHQGRAGGQARALGQVSSIDVEEGALRSRSRVGADGWVKAQRAPHRPQGSVRTARLQSASRKGGWRRLLAALPACAGAPSLPVRPEQVACSPLHPPAACLVWLVGRHVSAWLFLQPNNTLHLNLGPEREGSGHSGG